MTRRRRVILLLEKSAIENSSEYGHKMGYALRHSHRQDIAVAYEPVLSKPESVAVIRSHRSARAFVRNAWCGMIVIALNGLFRYDQSFPCTEDWLCAPALTGNEPHLALVL